MLKCMFDLIENFWQKEVKKHVFTYLLLAVVLAASFFVRVYRVDQLMWFFYDQGRDALVIWRLWHEGKPFLIGPVTGLAGIFLGPLYYYIIAPFYLIGGGNPVYPAVFLGFLATLALAVTYYLGWQMQSRTTGLIAASLGGFSYYIVLAGRWLSNPTLILLSSVLLLLSMWKVAEGGAGKAGFWWLIISLLIGISLQLESASAIFYIPMILVFYIFIYLTKKRMLPSGKIFGLSILIFFVTLLPQIVFNFRHENILLNNFKKVIIEEENFGSPFSSYNLIKKRDFFWGVFSSKVFPGIVEHSKLYYIAGLIGLVLALRKIPKAITILTIFIGVPMIGYIFFQGNYGNIYDYYLTGYYLPMLLLFSIGLGFLWKNWIGKIVVVLFFVAFFNLSGPLLKYYLVAGVDGSTHVSLGNEVQAVDWVFEDAVGSGFEEYNVDVYVPPVIPYTYDYLFLWRGTLRQAQGKLGCDKQLCGLVKERQLPVVYVLYEEDPPHPERLSNWFSKYEGSSIIEKQVKFGGITIQRRSRI